MEAVLCLHRGSRDVRTMLRIHLLDARPTSQLEGLELLPGKSHYFIGNDPGRWRTGIPHYARVKYREIYPQIDLIFYGNQGQVEYDFVVAPGADPKAIRLGFEGADHLSLDGQGNLILHTAGGQLLQRAPVIYQEINGTRRAIPGRYVLLECKGCQPGQGTQPVGFEVAAHDSTRPLIIERTPNPIPVLHLGSPQEALPLTLKPKQTLEVVFEVTFDCANDRAKSTPTNPRHADYRYVAVVDRKALDGAADSHPVDDLCPRSVTPPFEVDPNPDGKIKDRGCGEQKADKTLGADLLTDVVVK
ncbi:MAG: hypothetical protein HYY20_11185 [Candidatus Tectomicrobia bacterium]|uniref:DUF7948 domain-containing protein n=1 Tax=Tectimicrobiota bacterium TaxID=2528274 RepID=A0A932G1N1_UNCTE|nr:hypothetical protein [Candidatus Tectomicrobia bacterium]